jgi:NAD(P)-dependent dehydrogenase (short-subunit alcohol dehydrogenase family)
MPNSAATPILNGLKLNLRVLVTAGANGIGRAIADMLISCGARVHICDVADEALAEFARTNPSHSLTKADVANDADVRRMFEDVKRGLGGLDALINNAGIAGPTGGVEDISPSDWRRCIDVSLTGQFLCTHHAVPLIKAEGGGAIVNMSSVAGRLGYPFRTAYSAAKFGVIGFTQSLAKELGPHNIRVNAILPGVVEGPRMDKVIRDRAAQLAISRDEMEKRYLDLISLRRMVSSQDVAAMVAYLLSPMGKNISGQSIGIDGNVETL